ncbi:colicin-like pore-forming protein [Providencia huaxiensis]
MLDSLLMHCLASTIGILGYGLIIAGTGALINDSLVEEANNLIGI